MTTPLNPEEVYGTFAVVLGKLQTLINAEKEHPLDPWDEDMLRSLESRVAGISVCYAEESGLEDVTAILQPAEEPTWEELFGGAPAAHSEWSEPEVQA